MDLSKLKVEIYDLLGLIVPGLLAICEVWITAVGWASFAGSISALSGTTLTIVLLISFALGHLVQELADVVVKRWKGPRYFRKSRDAFWTSEEGRVVREAIGKELANEAPPVDGSFDYCLTKIQQQFPKRDLFIATSDLSRAIALLAITAIVPATRIVHGITADAKVVSGLMALSIVALLLICLVAWVRMVRFRDLSEVTVFRVYLATASERKP